jgi:hypothetical protein
MSTGLARNWWAIGLRGAAAILFAIAVLCLPASTIASLVLMFAAYVAADGAFAILAGMRAAGRGDRWRMLILEGAINLAAAAGVLVWSMGPRAGGHRVGRMGCIGSGNRPGRHADDWVVAGRLRVNLWFDPCGSRRPSAEATKGGGNSLKLVDPQLVQPWHFGRIG